MSASKGWNLAGLKAGLAVAGRRASGTASRNGAAVAGAGSTVGGAVLINCIKAEVAKLLTEAGRPPKVLSAGVVVGAERAVELFESAYDEHAHRLAKLYANVGVASYVSEL